MRTIHGLRSLAFLFVTVSSGLVGYLASCRPTPRLGERPECPHDWDFQQIRIRDSQHQKPTPLGLLSPSGTTLSTSGAQTNVPEFNDCQRLIRGTGDTARYDSLYAVFAWDRTDADTMGAKDAIESGKALPMAEVLSFGGTYEFLGIRAGLNCLFVYRTGATWRASLVPFGLDERNCHEPIAVASLDAVAHLDLAVKRTSYPDLHWLDYPAAARWEWDINTNEQVIGFKCLDGWCEAGKRPPETGPDLTARLSSVAALSGSPVLRIKGWYDEQRLEPTKPHWWTSGLGPTSVVGTVIPIPGLDRLNERTDFNPPGWHLIAYVELSHASSEYYATERFAPMTPPGRLTEISLCVERWTASTPPVGEGRCPVPDDVRQAAKCPPENLASATNHWWARTVPPSGSEPRYWCIVRRKVVGAPVPGTARWRWLAGDETTWGRCGSGCCTGQ